MCESTRGDGCDAVGTAYDAFGTIPTNITTRKSLEISIAFHDSQFFQVFSDGFGGGCFL